VHFNDLTAEHLHLKKAPEYFWVLIAAFPLCVSSLFKLDRLAFQQIQPVEESRVHQIDFSFPVPTYPDLQLPGVVTFDFVQVLLVESSPFFAENRRKCDRVQHGLDAN
jgi:hypothetical protein